MAVETLVSVEEYLHTSYDPEVEYVDGVLVERNVGDWQHSLIQSNLIVALNRQHPYIYAVPALRSQTSQTRYRVPDVCVLLSRPNARILLNAAFLVIEILSEQDSMTKMMEKLDEYEKKGVAHIWVIDPRLGKTSVYSGGDLREVKEDRIATADSRLELTREEVFQQ